MDDALRVREFWFGQLLTGSLQRRSDMDLRAQELARRIEVWFPTDPALMSERDEVIRSEFQELVDRAARGELANWADSPRRRLSLILLLDQFPRQIFRGTPRAFACDPDGLALSLSGMQSAADGALNIVERMFFYIPLQHAESTEVQEESVAAYRRLLEECPPEMKPSFESSLQSALEHRELILRFGRFPHRNAILGRESTPDEEAYLESTPERFGQ
jgi:uncharacterized protein (DUF924 family)